MSEANNLHAVRRRVIEGVPRSGGVGYYLPEKEGENEQ